MAKEKKITAPMRTNNPGSLMQSKIAWDGATGVDPVTNLVIFSDPTMGYRALLRQIYNAGHPQGKYFKKYGAMTLGDYMTKKYAPRDTDKYGTMLPQFGYDLNTPMSQVDLAKLTTDIPIMEGYGKVPDNVLHGARQLLMAEGFAPLGTLANTLLPAPEPMKPGVK